MRTCALAHVRLRTVVHHRIDTRIMGMFIDRPLDVVVVVTPFALTPVFHVTVFETRMKMFKVGLILRKRIFDTRHGIYTSI